MRFRFALLLPLLISGACLAAAPAPARTTVEAVAQAISANYFDPDKGQRIADALLKAAAKGEFDRYTNPAELATALSQRLQPEDAHFNVLHSATPPARPQRPANGGVAMDEVLRRSNHGFRKVEILPGNIGYIALGGFARIDFSNPKDPARQQADAALALTRNTDAMIVDVRQSPGGAPEMVGYLVSAFTPPGAAIYNVFHYRGGRDAEAPATPYPSPRLEQPLYILTSGRSASAAEGFSYTLQAAKRAEVVGEASAGGANPGGFVPVGGGFAVFVSGGSPVNPITGRNWEGTGVIPDHPVAAADALQEAQRIALRHLLAKADPATPRVDQQWALQALATAATAKTAKLEELVGQYQGLRIELMDGQLRAMRGKRGVMSLKAIEGDEFAVEGDSTFRYTFVRDERKAVIAVELHTAEGVRMRFGREA